MTLLFDFIVLVFILFYAYLGWEAGIWTASIAALEVLACLTLAVLLHEAAAGFLLSFVGSDLETWVIFFAFGVLAWGTFALIRYRLHTVDVANTELLEIDPLSDRIGGVIAGGIGGAIFVGGVLVTASMFPFLASFKPSGDRMLLDVGKLVLVTAGHFVTERPDGYEGPPLPIMGGPSSTKKDTKAILTSEPWFDVDDDAVFTDGKDRFRDVDGDGIFTKDLYAIDVEREGKRRIGLVDKYVVGRWDIELNAKVRKREDVKPDERKNKKKKKPGTEEPPPYVPPDVF